MVSLSKPGNSNKSLTFLLFCRNLPGKANLINSQDYEQWPIHRSVSVTKFPRYPCSAHPSLVWRQYQDRNHTSHNIETQYCGGMRYGSSGSNPTRLNSNSVYPYIHNIVLSYPDINVLNLIVSANVYRRKGTSWE